MLTRHVLYNNNCVPLIVCAHKMSMNLESPTRHVRIHVFMQMHIVVMLHYIMEWTHIVVMLHYNITEWCLSVCRWSTLSVRCAARPGAASAVSRRLRSRVHRGQWWATWSRTWVSSTPGSPSRMPTASRCSRSRVPAGPASGAKSSLRSAIMIVTVVPLLYNCVCRYSQASNM